MLIRASVAEWLSQGYISLAPYQCAGQGSTHGRGVYEEVIICGGLYRRDTALKGA